MVEIDSAKLFYDIDYSTYKDPNLFGDHVFEFCTFERLSDSIAVTIDVTFLGCTFSSTTFYWSHLNTALLSGCKFENCTFQGVAFTGCRFVECSFESCVFTENNLGGSCRFEDNKWCECSQENLLRVGGGVVNCF